MKKTLFKNEQYELMKAAAENDLEAFINLVHPKRVLGEVHREVIRWWTRGQSKTHQLLLLPRDHQKSALVAYRVAWEITRNPAVRILYISSTSNLANKQLKFIKDILTSDIYRYYWPEMVKETEYEREKWTESEISVDHPLRKAENVRDPTVFTAGLTTTITGMHCNIIVLDDVVVQENAYTEDGREKVEQQYSLLASIGEGDYREWVVGTRYHPKDLYKKLNDLAYEVYDESGEIIDQEPLYEKFERVVEDRGDGTGNFLWPRQQRFDGRWFGFDRSILSKKRSQYIDRVQFRAQYYNDPNDYETAAIPREFFSYYDKHNLSRTEGRWYYKGKRLNVFASVDFAFSLARKADYTAIVVVGVDAENNYYVLDIDRFKTDKIGDYFEHILRLHQRWDFRKVRCEVSVAQTVIVRDLKENYVPKYGLSLSVEEYRPSRQEGSKEERVQAILQPRYQNRQIWHSRDIVHCQTLEEELVLSNPPHDDLKDALASCIDACVAPTIQRYRTLEPRKYGSHTRFGGIGY